MVYMVEHKDPQYFEAILQLRNPNEELLNCVMNAVRKRKNVFIAKEVRMKGGVDYYISSQRFTRSLGNKLKKAFKGELKVSRKLFGFDRQRSRLIYRGTVLFKME